MLALVLIAGTVEIHGGARGGRQWPVTPHRSGSTRTCAPATGSACSTPRVFEFDVDGLAYVKDRAGDLGRDQHHRIDVPLGELAQIQEVVRGSSRRVC